MTVRADEFTLMLTPVCPGVAAGGVLPSFGTSVVGPLGGLYAAASPAEGRKGEWVQSGTWMETSTNGSMGALSIISRPEASLSRGSCWAEMIYGTIRCGKDKRSPTRNYFDVQDVLSQLAKQLLVG